MTTFIFLTISFLASTVGAICGIGGGVIIKPVLDAFGVLSVSTISFLSGCTVLAMSTYSVVKAKLAHENQIDMQMTTPLAIGAAIGGIVGKELFSQIKGLFENANTVGAVQAGCLVVITLMTLIYTINKEKIKTHKIEKKSVCLLIGLLLGIMSSFLGICGGPINLVVLYYFFSMTTKCAAQNSLYIIFFSQGASFLKTLIERSVPQVDIFLLAGMICCGLIGAMVGRKINKRINEKNVDILFTLLMVLIILINIYNVFKYC